jgi:hypothetical protein
MDIIDIINIINVINVSDEHKPLFAVCLEDWSADVREADSRRARWIDRFLARGRRGKLSNVRPELAGVTCGLSRECGQIGESGRGGPA